MQPATPLHRHLLLTGVPGCGKTTLLRSLADKSARFSPQGFYTEEIRQGGKREGFRLVGLDGATDLLAHVSFRQFPQVGKYGVAIKRLEDFLAARKLGQAISPLVFIDEIGKMEYLSPHFVALVRHLLDSPRILIATVALKGGGLIQEVKKRPDVMLVEVTPNNRDGLGEILVKRITDLATQ